MLENHVRGTKHVQNGLQWPAPHQAAAVENVTHQNGSGQRLSTSIGHIGHGNLWDPATFRGRFLRCTWNCVAKIFRLCPCPVCEVCKCKCSQMSSALHGYLDPSSTDKGAADETDKVNLQVLCLTGEGVALSVPRSMLGYAHCGGWCPRSFHASQAQSSPCITWMQSWGWIKPWRARMVGTSATLPALTYQQMCTEHGVTYVGLRTCEEILC